jgi:hypothetical protein
MASISFGEQEAWVGARWVFRSVVEHAIAMLPQDQQLVPLLQEGLAGGFCFLELSELPQEQRSLFVDALVRLRDNAKHDEAVVDPAFLLGFIEQLEMMLACMERAWGLGES